MQQQQQYRAEFAGKLEALLRNDFIKVQYFYGVLWKLPGRLFDELDIVAINAISVYDFRNMCFFLSNLFITFVLINK